MRRPSPTSRAGHQHEQPDSNSALTATSTRICYAGLLTSIPFGLSFIVPSHRHVIRSFAVKSAAYLTVGASTIGTIHYLQNEHRNKTLGSSQRARHVVSLLEARSEKDHFFLMGGVAGILAAAMSRRSVVRGWRKYVGAFTLGASASLLPVEVFESDIVTGLREISERASSLWQDFQYQHAVQGPFPSSMDPTPSDMQLLSMSRARPQSQGDGSGTASGGSSSSAGNQEGYLLRSWDGPHLTQKVPDDDEAHPVARTNYRWQSDDPIKDLESHISKIEARRREIAQEAEMLWSWLAAEEAKFYNTFGKEDESEEKDIKRRCLEVIGGLHSVAWAQATSCDWMIADARKRIEQHRSAMSNDGKINWSIGCSSEAAQVIPKHTSLSLRETAKSYTAKLKQLEQAEEQLAMAAIDPDFEEHAHHMIFDSKLNRMVTKREAIVSAKQDFEVALKQAHAACAAIDMVTADLKKEHNGR